MKYALIGCGRIAANHIKAAKRNKLNIAAVCDVLPEHMESLLLRCGLGEDRSIAYYNNFRTMLEKEKPQLVAIATESGLHADIALSCLEAGTNVIVEKPMSMSIADADRIISKSEKKGLKVCVCHQNRFNIAVSRLRRAIDEGKFGALSHGAVSVRWSRDANYYNQASWRGTWAQDGGCLMNQCIHGIDLLRWMMGDEVQEVYGQTRRRFHDYLEAEDMGVAVVKFKNGAVATIEGTTNIYPRNLEETLCIFGEKGTVRLGGESCNKIEVWRFDDEMSGEDACFDEETANVYGNGHIKLYADMIDAIKNDRTPYVGAQAGKSALELVLAIYKSQKEGRSVKLPLTDFACTDMEGVF